MNTDTFECESYGPEIGPLSQRLPARHLACRRFHFTDEEGGMAAKDGPHPVYDVWVTAVGDALFVNGVVGGYMQAW